jgi:co-chaperonin GroES (HSP10)
MQHKKDEYIFQLVTRAVKEIDSSEICRKREIFKILAKSEVNLEMKQILAKSARVISELQHYTEEAYNISQYILVHYFKVGDLIKAGDYPLQNAITFHNKKYKILKSKDIVTLEKVSIANKLLIKTLSEETRNALKEQLALVSKVGSTFTNLSLMYTYIENNDSGLQSEAKSRQWSNEYQET